LKTTGTSIVFTARTLAVGVAVWSFSVINFQADMGVLLMLLFVWNMIGTLVLTPALASVLVFARERERTGS
jgi:predicted RND superfamily exporter protein